MSGLTVSFSLFQCSVIEDTIVITEGNIDEKEIRVKLTGNPAALCNAGDVCKIKIDFELIEDESKMPQ